MQKIDIKKEDLSRILQFLSQLPLLSSVEENLLEKLTSFLELYRVHTGDVLIHQGEEDRSLYIIYQGRFKVTYTASDSWLPDHPSVLGYISRGNIVGEISYLTELPRSGTLTATRDSLVLKLPAQTINDIKKECPELLLRLANISLKRLMRKAYTQRHADFIKTIVLFPSGSSENSYYTEAFEEYLKKEQKVIFITKEWCIENFYFDPNDTGITEEQFCDLGIALEQLESDYDLIVFVADNTFSPWTDFTLRHADYLLSFADAEDGSQVNAIEISDTFKTLLDSGTPWHLVLGRVSSLSEKPLTHKWKAHRSLSLCTNVQSDDLHFGSILKAIKGERLGLLWHGNLLSSLTQFGLVRALEDFGYTIDFLFGSEVGYLFSIIYAKYGSQGIYDIISSDSFCLKMSKDALETPPLPEYLFEELKRSQIEDLYIEAHGCTRHLTPPLDLHNQGPLYPLHLNPGSSFAFKKDSDFLSVFGNYLTDNRLVTSALSLLQRGSLVTPGCTLKNIPIDLFFDQINFDEIERSQRKIGQSAHHYIEIPALYHRTISSEIAQKIVSESQQFCYNLLKKHLKSNPLTHSQVHTEIR